MNEFFEKRIANIRLLIENVKLKFEKSLATLNLCIERLH